MFVLKLSDLCPGSMFVNASQPNQCLAERRLSRFIVLRPGLEVI
jgi:hypothetical protein